MKHAVVRVFLKNKQICVFNGIILEKMKNSFAANSYVDEKYF